MNSLPPSFPAANQPGPDDWLKPEDVWKQAGLEHDISKASFAEHFLNKVLASPVLQKMVQGPEAEALKNNLSLYLAALITDNAEKKTEARVNFVEKFSAANHEQSAKIGFIAQGRKHHMAAHAIFAVETYYNQCAATDMANSDIRHASGINTVALPDLPDALACFTALRKELDSDRGSAPLPAPGS